MRKKLSQGKMRKKTELLAYLQFLQYYYYGTVRLIKRTCSRDKEVAALSSTSSAQAGNKFKRPSARSDAVVTNVSQIREARFELFHILCSCRKV